MALIRNIPESLLEEYSHWHRRAGSPEAGGRTIAPWPPGAVTPASGSGKEFLVWHSGYLERFHDWVAACPADARPQASLIESWTCVPAALKVGAVGWNHYRAEDEARLSRLGEFLTLDELGSFIERGIGGWLHFAASSMWPLPNIPTLDAPRMTQFWKLHGLIEMWHQRWTDQVLCSEEISERSRAESLIINNLQRFERLFGQCDEPARAAQSWACESTNSA